MVRSLVIVAFLASSGFGQIFPGAFWNRTKYQDSCPGGVCPTNQSTSGNWTNRDGLSHRQHVESAHGVSTAGMSEAQVQAHMNSYHNTYGAGHPVRGVAADVARVAAAPVKAVVQNQQVRREARYPAVSSGGVNYGSNGGSSGNFYVGGRDSKGDVITSIGDVVEVSSESVNYALSPAASSAQIRVGDRARLLRVMLAAAREAKAEGKSTSEIQSAAADAGIEELAGSTAAIDIDKWIEIIEKLIPLIMKLIEMFSSIQTINAYPYVSAPIRSVPVRQFAVDWYASV